MFVYVWGGAFMQHTHTYTQIYIYIYICVCVCYKGNKSTSEFVILDFIFTTLLYMYFRLYVSMYTNTFSELFFFFLPSPPWVECDVVSVCVYVCVCELVC